MDLAGLRTFVTVAAERSFSRAAEKLCRSQPAVSLAIRRLEDELGEPLFDRSGRGGRLTEAGEVLHAYAPRILRLVEEATAAVLSARHARPSTLTIGAEEWMLTALSPLLAAFRQAHQDVYVDLRIQAPEGAAAERHERPDRHEHHERKAHHTCHQPIAPHDAREPRALPAPCAPHEPRERHRRADTPLKRNEPHNARHGRRASATAATAAATKGIGSA